MPSTIDKRRLIRLRPVPDRHLETLRKFQSEEEFVEAAAKMGWNEEQDRPFLHAVYSKLQEQSADLDRGSLAVRTAANILTRDLTKSNWPNAHKMDLVTSVIPSNSMESGYFLYPMEDAERDFNDRIREEAIAYDQKYVHNYKGITQNKPLNEKTAYEEGLREVTVCGVSGMLPTAACRIDVNEYELITDYYAPGTEPTQPCNMHRTMRLGTRTKQSPSTYCYDTDMYGVIYMPEGHPLRYDSATNVRQYFWGASTSQTSAAVGTCTECATRRGASVTNSERDTILSYANRAIADANSLLNSARLKSEDFNKVTSARNALQLAMDEEAEIEVLRTLVSALKRVNEATHRDYGF